MSEPTFRTHRSTRAILVGAFAAFCLTPFAPALADDDSGSARELLHTIKKARLNDLSHTWDKFSPIASVNPTYSFKDRPVSIAITRARELGFDTIACASTGNLAGSVAAHAAKAGLKALIFIQRPARRSEYRRDRAYWPQWIAVRRTRRSGLDQQPGRDRDRGGPRGRQPRHRSVPNRPNREPRHPAGCGALRPGRLEPAGR